MTALACNGRSVDGLGDSFGPDAPAPTCKACTAGEASGRIVLITSYRDERPLGGAQCQHCDQPVEWSWTLKAFVHVATGTTACAVTS